MATKSDKQLGPWPLGIDNISNGINGPKGTVRDALNILFDRDGRPKRRPGMTRARTAPLMHSIWTAPTQGLTFCMEGPVLKRANLSNNTLNVQPIATLLSDSFVSYDELNGEVVFSNNSSAGIIKDGAQVRSLGVETGVAPLCTAVSYGGLAAGRYAVAATFLRGNEEGGVSDYVFVTVPDGGGIAITAPQPLRGDTTQVRVYRTECNSETLRRAADLPALGIMLLGVQELGRACETVDLDILPRGDIIRYWRGRLLVAVGDVLFYSEPMRYGLYNPTLNFVQYGGRIVMVEPVDGGVFVGVKPKMQGDILPRGQVFFHSGETPAVWTKNLVSDCVPVPGASMRVSRENFSGQLQGNGRVAMWLTKTGFVIGLGDGTLVQPQATRFRTHEDGRGAMAVTARRALAIIT